ncbi:MAG: UxaA family hydrolase, partial [Duncaniella sp.]|nr:UxaA family hydrolase [Duncaniella sp.]
MKEFIKINPADNVAVAISELKKGTVIDVDGDKITLVTDVPAGHKVALRDIAEGENVIKYGFPIG